MRKYAAILCATLLIGNLTACKKADIPADSKPTTSAVTTTTTTATTTTQDGVKAPINLTYAGPFSDGVALVRYLDADGVEWSAAINAAGQPLFHLPADVPYEGDGYRNGIRVVDNVIYDKTGAILASPEMSGYDSLMTGNCGGYVLAKKVAPVSLPAPAPEAATTTTAASTTTTTAATDDTTQTTAPTGGLNNLPVTSAVTLSIGVLNNKGEWVHPLSPEHPIAQAITRAAQPTESLTYLTGDVLMVLADAAATAQYYSFKTNTLTDNYAHYESINYQDEDTGIYQVAADGTKKMVVENVVSDYFFKDAFIGRTNAENEAGEPITLVKLYDYSGKVLADLTDYPLWGNRYYYIYDRLIVPIDDGSGNRQLVILHKDGTAACDPVVLGLRDTFYTPDETGVVVESHTADGAVSYCHYAWDGTVTPYTDVATFKGFSEGLAAVTLTDGTLCYINHKAEIVIK